MFRVMTDPVRPPPPPRVLGSLGEFDPDKDNISHTYTSVPLNAQVCGNSVLSPSALCVYGVSGRSLTGTVCLFFV